MEIKEERKKNDPDFGRSFWKAEKAARPRAARGRRHRPWASADPDRPAAPPPSVVSDNPLFVPPFVGKPASSAASRWTDIGAYLNETALFSGPKWGYRPGQSPQQEESDRPSSKIASGPELAGPAEAAGSGPADRCCSRAVAYGYFAVNSEGDDLIVWKRRRPARLSGCASPSLAKKHRPVACVDFLTSFRSSAFGRRRLRRLPRRPPWGEASFNRGRARLFFPRTVTRTISTCTGSESKMGWSARWRSFGTTGSARRWGFSSAKDGPHARRASSASKYRGGRVLVGLRGLPPDFGGQRQVWPSWSGPSEDRPVEVGEDTSVASSNPEADHRGPIICHQPASQVLRGALAGREEDLGARGRCASKRGRTTSESMSSPTAKMATMIASTSAARIWSW